jgi:hypothetical protein
MSNKQQMRRNRATVQPFLGVRQKCSAITLEDAFRRRYSGFRRVNGNEVVAGSVMDLRGLHSALWHVRA